MPIWTAWVWCRCEGVAQLLAHACGESCQESRMRENRTSGSMRGE